jgi:protein-S-isoprenylcysteine O-methyltransferase Ste14
MDNENTFRIGLLVVLVLRGVIALHYLRPAKAAGLLLGRREEGVFLSVAIGLPYLAYCVGIVVYLIKPEWMAWSSTGITPWVRWIGFVPLFVGGAVILWGAAHLRGNFALSIATKKHHTLVKTGPYRYVRHPLYSAVLVEAVGVSLLMANWFVAVMVAVFWIVLIYRTRLEESNLINRFGDEYKDYMTKSGRFVPSFRR